MNNRIAKIGMIYGLIVAGLLLLIMVEWTALNCFSNHNWYIVDEAWPFLWSLSVSGLFAGLVWVSVPEEIVNA